MQQADDKGLIQQLVDNWSIFCDAGNWSRFAECWHDDGVICGTWFQARYTDFVAARLEGFESRVSIIHSHGGFTCDVAGDRAVSQTRMTISQRAELDQVLVDVTTSGRFYDFHEKRNGRWGMVRRQPIYERDRMDAVDPAAVLKLDQTLLQQFPAGYRYLAYLQYRLGYKVVKRGLPESRGPEVERLYAESDAWLAGAATPGRSILAL